MKAVIAFALAVAVINAYAATKEEIINNAVKKGARIVVCQGGDCVDFKTQELVGHGEDGMYLQYPLGHEEEEKETAQQLQAAR